MLTSDYNFDLPPELIAQRPPLERGGSRLLRLNRQNGICSHEKFANFITHLKKGDVLVLNNSRVIPARLHGINKKTGGQFEMLLVEENAENDWWALMKPGKRAHIGTEIIMKNNTGESVVDFSAQVIATNSEGHRRLKFQGGLLHEKLDAIGEIPLPPYINRKPNEETESDRMRYQTVYASPAGSVAAPTAGLHFTPSLLDEMRLLGIEIHFVTLHVGMGTFAPVKSDDLAAHVMHEERYSLSNETADAVNRAKREHRRVIAVGTTSLRVLESVAATNNGELSSGVGRTKIFIHPPYRFRIVDALLTNFHLPKSTLLMLVSAFSDPGGTSGRERILGCYHEAIREKYRFFSYGDAMFIQ
jgi:S-adenosylmethionine:tRNA ribosyltransferase-isomerase